MNWQEYSHVVTGQSQGTSKFENKSKRKRTERKIFKTITCAELQADKK